MNGEEIIPAAVQPPPVPAASPEVSAEPVVPVRAAVPAIPGTERLKPFADIPIHLTIEIGRLQVMLGELTTLKPGKIFRIRKSVGEPFDICANGQPVAKGEVIVVENSSGVRITEVIKL